MRRIARGIHQSSMDSPRIRPVIQGFEVFVAAGLNKPLKSQFPVLMWSHNNVLSRNDLLHLKKYTHRSEFVVFCYGMVQNDFTHTPRTTLLILSQPQSYNKRVSEMRVPLAVRRQPESRAGSQVCYMFLNIKWKFSNPCSTYPHRGI